VVHVVSVVGWAPGEGTTVCVVTETVSPGLGCRTRVIVFGTVGVGMGIGMGVVGVAGVVVVVVVGVTAGTVVAGVEPEVRRVAAFVLSAGTTTDVVVVAVAAEGGGVARSGWRARTLCVRRTNDGAAASASAVVNDVCSPDAWTRREPAVELI
jgi:hypothetical protein